MIGPVIPYDPRRQGLEWNAYLAKEWRRYVVGPDVPRYRSVEDITAAPGVYFVFHASALTYVGMSFSVRTRLLQHRQHGRPISECAMVSVEPDLLAPVELAYIHALRPPGNRLIEPPRVHQHFDLFDAIQALWSVPQGAPTPGDTAAVNAEQAAC